MAGKERVGRRGKRLAPVSAKLADQLHRALRDGDAVRVRAIIHGAFRQGASIHELADRAIGPAMEQIGRDWEKSRIDVMDEHRASELCAAALYELKAILQRRAGKSRPRAVGGAPAKDKRILWYSLGGGAAAVGVGLLAYGIARKLATSDCGGDTWCNPDDVDRADRQAIGGLVSGSVLLAAGAALFVVGAVTHKKSDRQAKTQCGIGYASASCRFQF